MFLPAFNDPEQARRARLLLLILLILIPALAVLALSVLVLMGDDSSLVMIAGGLLVVSLGLFGMLRLGYVMPTAYGLVAMLAVANTLGASSAEFVNISGAYTAYGLSNGIVMLLAAFLLSWWSAVPIALLLLVGQQIGGFLNQISVTTGVVEALILLTFSLVISLFARSLQHSLRHARQQESVAQEAAARAADLNTELEARLRDTHSLLEQERHLRDTINQLTVPVQEIGERVLFAPLIGHIDALRGKQITETVLHTLHAARAHTIIIDVQGVSTIDTSVAQQLDQLIQAIQLLGSRVVLTGISAQMAATVTQLGINFRNVALYPSVSSALQATAAPQSRAIEVV